MQPVTKRIQQLIKVISANVYEKELVFNLAMLALLSGESIFLLGKPGIAKSLVSRRIKYVFHSGRNFEYLMNRFSTPEEIFGPISIEELLKGKYIRLIDQYLPDVDIAFLDEIWKAGPSIQNTLLTIINEKIFRNGGKDIKVPLKLLISASNELPESGKGLEALFDRFIIRMIVYGLNDKDNFNEMLQSVTSLEVKVPASLQIKEKEYESWLKELNKVILSPDTLSFIDRFRHRLNEATQGKAYISDRRWKKIAHLIKASAFYNDRKITDKVDLLIIPYCIWDDEEQEKIYTKIFNQAFVEELTYDLKKKQDELEAKLDSLHNSIQNVNDLKESKTISPSLYSDPFGNSIKGEYYRIIWENRVLPICFINVHDYKKLAKNPKKSQKVTMAFGPTLNQLHKKENFNLQFKSENELIDITNNNIYHVELQSLTDGNNLAVINNEIKETESAVLELKKEKAAEENRLKGIDSIFFSEQYKLLLETAFFNEGSEDEIITTDTSTHPDFMSQPADSSQQAANDNDDEIIINNE